MVYPEHSSARGPDMIDSSIADVCPPRADHTRRIPRREAWLAGALLLALMLAVHYDVVFLGRSLVLSNFFNPFDSRPLAQNYGDHFVAPEEWTSRNLWFVPNIRDPVSSVWQWEPALRFLQGAIKRNEWPFWNPYTGGGTPAMANAISAPFFPPSLLVVTLGATVHLWNAYFLVLLWGASFSTYLFVRRHDLGFIASLAGGALVMMSGGLNQTIGSFMMQPVACTPIALYATRLFLDSPNSRRAAGLALVYAAIALASFPPITLGVFAVTGSYAVTAIAVGDSGRSRWQAGFGWIGAALLGMGLVAFYYVPIAALRSAAPQVAVAYAGGGLETMPAINTLQLLSPTLMGGAQVYISAPFAAPVTGPPHIPYVGIMCALLALLARAHGPRRCTLLCASGLAVGCILLKLFGMPPVQWIGYLPVFDQVHFAYYFGMVLGFPLSFLAALGVESVIRRTVSLRRAIGASALAGIALATIVRRGLWWLVEHPGALNSQTAGGWIRDVTFVATLLFVSAIILALVTLSGRTRTKVGLAAGAALLGMIAIEGIYNNTYPNPSAWDAFGHPVPFVRALQAGATLKRVLAFGAPAADDNEAFEIFSLDSLMAFNPPRIFELYRRYTGSPSALFMRGANTIPPETVLDRGNIAIVSVSRVLPEVILAARARGYRTTFDDGEVTVFERPTLPRFFYSSQYRVLPKAAALDAVGSGPSHEIVLEEQPGFASTVSGKDEANVFVERYARNSVALYIDAPRAGLVFASESYFDGWTVLVNGAPSRILPANYAFRAVEVPAGHSRIEFHYWPPGLTLGLAISAASMSFVLMLAFLFPRALGARGRGRTERAV